MYVYIYIYIYIYKRIVNIYMEERMSYLESTIGDSANRHAKEIEQLKVSATRLQTNSEQYYYYYCYYYYYYDYYYYYYYYNKY